MSSRRRWRRFGRYLVDGLIWVGSSVDLTTWAMLSGHAPGPAPDGPPPGHPERLVGPDIPEAERELWAQLLDVRDPAR